MPDQGGDALVPSVRDITERNEVDRIKDEFVSVVSHELRTPLTSIHGALGLLVGGVAGEVNPGVSSMLEIARRNSNRLLLLINDILDMQKIESGVLQFKKDTVDLNLVALNSVETNSVFARQYGVKLCLDLKETRCLAVGDSDRILQVLANLISNACKFSHEGGEVQVSVTREDSTARVAVSDHGPGIPEEFQERIFQKFAQADSSDTRRKGGTGLGLSISRAIVTRMNGNLGFETEKGKGTTFYFELPLAPSGVVKREGAGD